METYLAILITFTAIILLIAIRIPIGLALIAVAFAGISWEVGIRGAIGAVSRIPYEMAANWSFSAAPMFLLMGFICTEARLTTGLFEASKIMFRRVPGSLASASVMASALFASASGSSTATAAAMSKIAVPEMKRNGYDEGLACATVAASGTLGSLIPPSILMILLGVYADISIGQLFLAGVIPGIVSAAIYVGMIVIRCKLNPALAGGEQLIEIAPARKRELLAGILPLPILIALVMGTIFFGIATPTEAGALGAAGAILIAFVTGRMNLRVFRNACTEAALSFSSLFIIIIGGALLTRYVAISGIGRELQEFFISIDSGPLLLLLMTSILLIVLGMFIDSIGLLLLVTPIVFPIAQALGMDLIWFGIIIIKLLEIGMITPPVGLNIYVIKSTLGDQVELSSIFRGVGWFVAMDILTLIILIAFPIISLWLPIYMRT